MVRTSTFLSAATPNAAVGLLRTLNGAAAGLHQSVVTDLLFLREFQRCLLPRRYRRIPAR